MKITCLAFLLVAFLAVTFATISAPVALADGTDPVVFTKGCGGVGQPKCDVIVLGPGQTTATISETFSCDLSGNCIADDSIINETGKPLTNFSLVWQTTGLTFTCAEGGFFTCTGINGNTETFAGGPLCSTDSNDVSIEDGVVTFRADRDEDDSCFGVTIELTATTSEGITNGETVTAAFSTPEPSSAMLLLFGLLAGFVGFKFVRNVPA